MFAGGWATESAAIRVPMYNRNEEKSKRMEYRVSDPTSNIYLLESALLLAGLDGIKNKTDPGDPVEENVYKLTPEKKREYNIGALPFSLKGALDSLTSDCKFLEEVFTKDFLDKYVRDKVQGIQGVCADPHRVGDLDVCRRLMASSGADLETSQINYLYLTPYQL